MDDLYFKWLLERIEVYDYKAFNYKKLCRWLFNEPFIWSIRNDENRAGDGLALRSEYIRQGGHLTMADRPCSVLEMLVALSVRVDRDILGDPDVYRGGKLFWIMIEHLGLDVYDDSFFDEEAVSEIVDIWLERRFKEDGSGSIFRVRNHVRNQKKIEIWYQTCDFLNENFGENW